MNELKRCDEDFIGVCMVCVLAPRELMIPHLPHKCDGKLMFLLCKKCSLRNNVQRLPCKHNDQKGVGLTRIHRSICRVHCDSVIRLLSTLRCGIIERVVAICLRSSF